MKNIDFTKLSESQKIAAKRALQTVLKMGVIPISFEKADGTSREMMATLNKGMVAELHEQAMKTKPKQENYEIVHVWDFDAKGWRSFRVDRIRIINGHNASEFLKPIIDEAA